MWSLTKGSYFLPEVSLKKLREYYHNEKKAKSKLRLLCAIHRKQGKSIDDIALLLEKPRKTIHGWIYRFQQRGIDGKDNIKQSGRPATLTIKQRRYLLKYLERGPAYSPSGLWTTKEVKELIERKYKQKFVHQHVWRMIVSLGFTLQRPRKQHYKQPPKGQLAQFKKKLTGKQGIIVQEDLLWAHKMRQHLGSSHSL